MLQQNRNSITLRWPVAGESRSIVPDHWEKKAGAGGLPCGSERRSPAGAR